jgi:nucleoside-diphosphate-sugar epimerase
MTTQGLRVLVTGSAGHIGRAACAGLRDAGHWVRGFDQRQSVGVDEAVQGDLSERAAVDEAARGMDVIVHLGATPFDQPFMQQILPNNIVGVYNVLEAAREAGVRRVLLASSGQVVMGHPGPWPVTPDMLPAPRNWYAAAKVLSESAGQIYAHVHGMQVLVVRLGWCPRDADHAAELAQDEAGKDAYLSWRDAGRFFACAVSAPLDSPYHIVFATSRPYRNTRYDISNTRALLGYEPLDRWPSGTEDLS